MPYTLGASFSNVQHSFKLPAFFVAMAIRSDRKPLLRNLRTKDEIMEDPEYEKNPFDLHELENEISRFEDLIIKSKVITLSKRYRKKVDNDLSFILDGYLKVIRSISSSNLYLASEGFEKCFLHIPLDQEGKELAVEDLSYFHHPLSKYKVKFQRKGNFDRILELARLYAWFENSNLVRRQPAFINKQCRTNINFDFLQIHKLVWNNAPIEYYVDGFVGYPRLIMKTKNGMTDTLVSPEAHIDIFPISPACLGTGTGIDAPKCLQASFKKPFGAILSGKFEMCPLCIKHAEGSLCSFQKPKCDGIRMLCNDRKFISGVCHSDFSVYVTLYNDKVKIGRCMKSRVVGRLIEQCAFDGLAFYPIPWLPFADYLEEKLTSLLRDNMCDLKEHKISRVTETIRSTERYEHTVSLCENSDERERDSIYEKIIDLLKSLDSPEAVYLSSLECRKINLKENWITPK
jgi:hypothetical protein